MRNVVAVMLAVVACKSDRSQVKLKEADPAAVAMPIADAARPTS